MPNADSVLIVDDEVVLRSAICDFLHKSGYDTADADSCTETLEIVRQKRPDAAVIDYALPDGNALELMEGLKAVDPVLPCIVLTGHGSIDLEIGRASCRERV